MLVEDPLQESNPNIPPKHFRWGNGKGTPQPMLLSILCSLMISLQMMRKFQGILDLNAFQCCAEEQTGIAELISSSCRFG
mmetsp:Transcript_14917/g.22222  ORF Transcript_14917/g.22222 Transcript_14917/m.22222 type:complete len:80 (+) Transcript_14917:110-349(+)